MTRLCANSVGFGTITQSYDIKNFVCWDKLPLQDRIALYRKDRSFNARYQMFNKLYYLRGIIKKQTNK